MLIERGKKKLRPNLEDFDITRVIGKGGFSTVFQGKYFKSTILLFNLRSVTPLLPIKYLSSKKDKSTQLYAHSPTYWWRQPLRDEVYEKVADQVRE